MNRGYKSERTDRVLSGTGDDISWPLPRQKGKSWDDDTQRNWTVFGAVPSVLFLASFWDVLVDPLRRTDGTEKPATERNKKDARFILVAFLLVFLVGFGRADSPLSYRQHTAKVCGSIDIRNNVSNFDPLRTCEVIEGNLQIVLVTNSNCEKCNELINNITFPELREVTGFVLFWRVQGLRSLGTLFPNLSVIRGRTLFENYALVAYEMKSLQEIGLVSLTHILRGSVRFDKNPSLCFVDTIEWDWIAPKGANRHFLGDNRPEGECVKCPSHLNCPKSDAGEILCWNKEHCQKDYRMCSRTPEGECCHEYCLGGCTGTSSKDCTVCRDVVLGNECLQHCPENMYKYLDRRCVTEQQCYNIPKPLELKEVSYVYPFRPIEGNCLPECPANYAEVAIEKKEGRRFYCQRCEGRCKKECKGANIDSIASAQKFSGCTHIQGSLEIQLRVGGNVVKELEESLSSVEEITGYLKIARSLPLISLDFLKNLKVIGGKELDNNKSAFVLLDNENLQELWDWTVKDNEFTIQNGRLAFHFNPKLCFYKIEKFKEIAKTNKGRRIDFTEDEVPRGTNGDKEACNITSLEPYVAVNEPYGAIIKWKQYQHYDSRTLLGYAIYYTKAPFKNVTLYNGRDACGGDGWIIDDVAVPEEDNKDEMTYPMTQLKPFTQYAYFIKTYTIKTERSGAQSPIQYFTTHPATPTRPTNVYAYANSSSEIIIGWEPPTEINGNLSHYIVEGFVEPEVLEDEERDYCLEPLVISPNKQPVITPPTPAPKPEPDGCVCKPGKTSIKDSDDVRQGKIDFEDALQNSFFFRRTTNAESKRKKRDSPNISDNNVSQLLEQQLQKITGEVEASKAFRREVTESRLVVRDLKYFTKYRIHIQACREVLEKDNDTEPACSLSNVYYVRTKKSETADIIPIVELSQDSLNGTGDETRLRWEEPERPNGLIMTYLVEYRRADHEKYKPITECISRQKFLESKKEHVLKNLVPGNWTVRVLASSLAGNGPFSPYKNFYVLQGGRSGSSDVWAGVVGALAVSAGAFGLFVFWKRKNRRVPKLFANVNPEYVSAGAVYVPDEWEVPRKNIELIRELGQGSFGMVYEGIAKDIVKGEPEVKCAVKTVNEAATDRDRMEFLNEASVMKAFNTHHVVRLLGVVSEGQPTLVVMELMVNGDLKTYLRSHRPENCEETKKQPPTLKRILRMAIEIADGMAYLAAKKFVHRDLAARNCMVAEDLTVKIGDFGMTRDIYETDYYKKGTKGLLPVRWMAPESLKDGVFTSHSDVWSYGIVLWEMVTLASQPYQGLSNDQVLRYVIEGGVMERPENCPDKLYELMKRCWQFRPTSRPHFMEFVTGLLPDASPDFSKNSYYHSPEGRELKAHMDLAEGEREFPTPETPLRIARDIEDFSVGCSEGEMDEEEEEAELEVEPPFVSPKKGFSFSVPGAETWYKNRGKPVTLASASSSDSSRGSKVSNGTATTPTRPNGYVVGRNSNGTRNTPF